MLTPNLQRRSIGVNPEDDVLIANASRNVGLGDSSNAAINNTLAQVGKQIVNPLFEFNLEPGTVSTRPSFHRTSKLTDAGGQWRPNCEQQRLFMFAWSFSSCFGHEPLRLQIVRCPAPAEFALQALRARHRTASIGPDP